MKCPLCRSPDVSRCHVQRWHERLAACLLLSICQCRHCLSRFYVFRWQVPANRAANPIASWNTAASNPARRPPRAA